MLDECDFASMPRAMQRSSASLLVRPSSLASSWTRTFFATDAINPSSCSAGAPGVYPAADDSSMFWVDPRMSPACRADRRHADRGAPGQAPALHRELEAREGPGTEPGAPPRSRSAYQDAASRCQCQPHQLGLWRPPAATDARAERRAAPISRRRPAPRSRPPRRHPASAASDPRPPRRPRPGSDPGRPRWRPPRRGPPRRPPRQRARPPPRWRRRRGLDLGLRRPRPRRLASHSCALITVPSAACHSSSPCAFGTHSPSAYSTPSSARTARRCGRCPRPPRPAGSRS